MGFFTVYRHISPSGKSYVGITKRNPVVRWNNGKGYAGQPKFYNAILKYGWDNFKHEILFSGLSKQEAEEKEKELIEQNDSIENGYNVSVGGRYGHEGAYKYREGEVYGSFQIVSHNGEKIVLKCLECGRELERYGGSIQKGCVKCKCKIKYNPVPKPQNHITYNGKTQSAKKWAKELGIPDGTIRYRYKKGLPIDAPIQDKYSTKERRCKSCGKNFLPRSRNQKYCCNECAVEALRIKRPEATCKYCGETFQTKRSVNNDYKAMFCSRECHIKWQKKGST